MYTNQDGSVSELNPKPIRVIKNMGDKSIGDYVFFLGILIIGCLPIVFTVNPTVLFGVPDQSLFTIVIKLAFCLPVIMFAGVIAFVRDIQHGRLRTRL
jgi:hypothetical protein